MIRVSVIGATSDPVDVTDYVVSATWAYTLTAPYETIQLSMALPWPESEKALPVTEGTSLTGAGFWVVISPHKPGPALAWGRCVAVDRAIEIDKDTGVPRTRATLTCQSWATLLAASRFVVAVKTDYVRKGFSVELEDYSATIKEILRNILSATPGDLLGELWKELARVRLPRALGDAAIADAIPAVTTPDEASLYAPLREKQHLEVPGTGLQVAGPPIPRGTVWQYLTSTFQPHPLIEMFPTLEHPAESDGRNTRDWTEPQRQLWGALGGATPVLVYRMRPRLLASLQTRGSAADRALLFGSSSVTPTETGVFEADEVFHSFGVNDIHQIRVREDDARRCNGVFVRTPMFRSQSQFEVQGVGGMVTIVYDSDVTYHGLRMQTIEWPFYPPALDDDSIRITDKVEALTELLFALSVRVDDVGMATASLRTRFRPETRAGHWIKFTGLQATGESTTGAWLGYAERVEHSVSVDENGHFRAHTSVELGDVSDDPQVFVRSEVEP